MAAEPVIPCGGLKHRFHVTHLCTDQGTWILKQLDSDINKHFIRGVKNDSIIIQEWKRAFTQYGRPRTPPSTLWFSDGVLMSHISAPDCRTDSYFYFVKSAIWHVTMDSLSMSLFLLQQVEANEAGCVSYADSYKALYGFHTGQWGTQDIFLGFVAVKKKKKRKGKRRE